MKQIFVFVPLVFVISVNLFTPLKTNEEIKVTNSASNFIEIEKELNQLQNIKITNSKKDVNCEEFKVLDIKLSPELQKYTYDLCKELNIDYYIALGIMKLESNFNQNLVSKTKDYGLMQLHYPNEKYYEWHKKLSGIENLDYFNPQHNIKTGLLVYKYYRDYWKDKVDNKILNKVTLLSYNRGIEGAKRYIKNNGINHYYNITILKYAEEFKKEVE